MYAFISRKLAAGPTDAWKMPLPQPGHQLLDLSFTLEHHRVAEHVVLSTEWTEGVTRIAQDCWSPEKA